MYGVGSLTSFYSADQSALLEVVLEVVAELQPTRVVMTMSRVNSVHGSRVAIYYQSWR